MPPSKAGPGVVVLFWADELGPIEKDQRVERVRSMSEDFTSLVGASSGTGIEHVVQLQGASRR